MEPFEFPYLGKTFFAEPKALYELAGLIVSHNDVTSITDAYNDSSEVNFRDLCIVWGQNLRSGIYRSMRFWSEPWTCFAEADQDWETFRQDQLSNTHLLTAKMDLRNAVWKARRGDQVFARGILVDYCPVGESERMRRSSLVRTDTGNGACEVMFIDEFEILQRGSSPWHSLYEWSWYGSLILAPAALLLWLCAIWAKGSPFRRKASLN
jgi:hypothetical protein